MPTDADTQTRPSRWRATAGHDQELGHRVLASLSGDGQRGAAAGVGALDRGAVREQRADHLDVATLARPRQGGPAGAGARFGIRSALEQDLSHAR